MSPAEEHSVDWAILVKRKLVNQRFDICNVCFSSDQGLHFNANNLTKSMLQCFEFTLRLDNFSVLVSFKWSKINCNSRFDCCKRFKNNLQFSSFRADKHFSWIVDISFLRYTSCDNFLGEGTQSTNITSIGTCNFVCEANFNLWN